MFLRRPTAGLNLSGAAKAAVTEYFIDTGEFAYDNDSAGMPAANSISGAYVSSVAVDGGNVVVTYGNRANAIINGGSIVLVPNIQSEVGLTWTCSSTSIAPKHLPAACR